MRVNIDCSLLQAVLHLSQVDNLSEAGISTVFRRPYSSVRVANTINYPCCENGMIRQDVCKRDMAKDCKAKCDTARIGRVPFTRR